MNVTMRLCVVNLIALSDEEARLICIFTIGVPRGRRQAHTRMDAGGSTDGRVHKSESVA